MGTVDDYLDGLDEPDREAIAHVYAVAARTAGETAQGVSYGMPALLYRGKALLSVMRTKRHIGVYPFSGRVPASVAAVVGGFEYAKGTIRFSPQDPLPDAVVEAVVLARMAEIDDPSRRRRRGQEA